LSIRKDFKIERTARYYLSNEPSSLQPYLCFVLHGYGQHSEFFLRKFEKAQRSDILFVAPEGLHRFYLQGSSGRVGSSWMTKEDRLNDIDDYCEMLDQVAAMIMEHQRFEKVAIFGFSQGVATACRWANSTNLKFETLINWAGAFPPDLDFETALENFRPKELHMLCGDDDEFISEQRLEEHLNFLKEKGLHPKLHRFEGKHDIYEAPLKALLEEVFPTHPNP